jgi:hypothetical protein
MRAPKHATAEKTQSRADALAPGCQQMFEGGTQAGVGVVSLAAHQVIHQLDIFLYGRKK